MIAYIVCMNNNSWTWSISFQAIKRHDTSVDTVSDGYTRRQKLDPVSDGYTRWEQLDPVSDGYTRGEKLDPVSDGYTRGEKLDPVSDGYTLVDRPLSRPPDSFSAGLTQIAA